MKIHVFVLAFGALLGAVVAAQAHKKIQDVKFPHAPPTGLAPGPLEALQADFGKVVGDAFHNPDPIINAPAANAPGAPGPVLGHALKASLDFPGAIFAGVMQPAAAVDGLPAAAAAPAARPMYHRHHRHAGGYHRVSPATAG